MQLIQQELPVSWPF